MWLELFTASLTTLTAAGNVFMESGNVRPMEWGRRGGGGIMGVDVGGKFSTFCCNRFSLQHFRLVPLLSASKATRHGRDGQATELDLQQF